jgi:hypothetical protein
MKGETVLYDNRVVPKEGFRAFVYGMEGKIKLVNSWQEFQDSVSSGLWFSSKDKVPEKAKHKKKGDE